jgi:hypothetical protein
MACASMRVTPLAPLLAILSLPARSIRFSFAEQMTESAKLALDALLPLSDDSAAAAAGLRLHVTRTVSTKCDRDDRSFSLVLAMRRLAVPTCLLSRRGQTNKFVRRVHIDENLDFT